MDFGSSGNILLFSHWVISDSLWPYVPQHARLLCPSPSPGICLNSCPLRRWCHPAILSSTVPFSFFNELTFHLRVFSNELTHCIRGPKYWSFSISPSEYSGLISLKIYLLDLLAVQGTLKSFLQHHSSKASILWHLAFFIVQLLHPYVTTGKTVALTIRTFVG